MAKLIISSDGRDKVYEIIDERFTIGSGPDADLQLRGDGISGQHLTVDKTKAGYRLIDMETKDGTLVNGKQVNQHVLGNGDTIQIGDVKLTYMGKGPARAGAAAGKSRTSKRGPKLESSHYYRHANKPQTTGGARLAMIGSGVLGILFILYLALSNTQPPQSDINRSKLMEAIRLCEHGSEQEETIVATIREFEKMDKSEEEKRLLARLRKKWDECLAAVAGAKASDTADSAWIKVRNVQNGEAQNRDKLRKMVEDYIEKYEGEPGRTMKHVRQAKAILADLEEMGEMTPDEKELARVESLVREGLNKRDHHLSMRGLKSMDPEVRAAHQDVWESLYRSIRRKSRQYLGVRKNEVRGWLRKDEDIVDEKKDPEKDIYDPAKAREVAIERIFKKLLHEVVVDYLNSPDKSQRAWNQRADERAQALFRELLKEIKPNY